KEHRHSLAVRIQARDRPFAVDARLRVQGNPLSWDEVNARGYLDVHGQQLQEWLPKERQWPLDVAELNGRVRLWAHIRDGQPSAGTLRLASPKVVLTDGDKPWPLTDLSLSASLHR